MTGLFDVAGRHVLVTGGSRGIGEMIVRGSSCSRLNMIWRTSVICGTSESSICTRFSPSSLPSSFSGPM